MDSPRRSHRRLGLSELGADYTPGRGGSQAEDGTGPGGDSAPRAALSPPPCAGPLPQQPVPAFGSRPSAVVEEWSGADALVGQMTSLGGRRSPGWRVQKSGKREAGTEKALVPSGCVLIAGAGDCGYFFGATSRRNRAQPVPALTPRFPLWPEDFDRLWLARSTFLTSVRERRVSVITAVPDRKP